MKNEVSQNLTVIPECVKNDLNKRIAVKECRNALSSKKTDQMPGNAGQTVEFYKEYF